MDIRENFIVAFRGEAIGGIGISSTIEETFQNATLRPILKFQNELLIAVFKNYISKYKGDFQSYSTDKKLQYIENAIQKDIKFRNAIKGMVIGWFSLEEYALYIQNSSNLNKRMMNLVIERLKSQVLLFESAA